MKVDTPIGPGHHQLQATFSLSAHFGTRNHKHWGNTEGKLTQVPNRLHRLCLELMLCHENNSTVAKNSLQQLLGLHGLLHYIKQKNSHLSSTVSQHDKCACLWIYIVCISFLRYNENDIIKIKIFRIPSHNLFLRLLIYTKWKDNTVVMHQQ